MHTVFLFVFIINLFLAALGLCCCMWAFSSCSERGLPFVAVHDSHCSGFLLQSMDSRRTGSVVVAHGLSSCSTRAQ